MQDLVRKKELLLEPLQSSATVSAGEKKRLSTILGPEAGKSLKSQSTRPLTHVEKQVVKLKQLYRSTMDLTQKVLPQSSENEVVDLRVEWQRLFDFLYTNFIDGAGDKVKVLSEGSVYYRLHTLDLLLNDEQISTADKLNRAKDVINLKRTYNKKGD